MYTYLNLTKIYNYFYIFLHICLNQHVSVEFFFAFLLFIFFGVNIVRGKKNKNNKVSSVRKYENI